MPRHPPPNITKHQCLTVLLCLQHGLTLKRIAPFFHLSKRGLVRWIEEGKKGNKPYKRFYTAYNHGKGLKNLNNALRIYEEMQDKDIDRQLVVYESIKNAQLAIIDAALSQLGISYKDYRNYYKDMKKRLNQI